MKTISVRQLKAKMEAKEPFQLIDVREKYEREICALQSEHIPLENLIHQKDRLRKDIPVILHCRAGDRAKAAVAALEQKHGFTNVYNLEGGIMAWAEQFDPEMEKY